MKRRNRTYYVTKLVRGFMPAIDRVPVIVRVCADGSAEIRLNRVTLDDARTIAERHLAKFTGCTYVSIHRGTQRLAMVTRPVPATVSETK